MKGENYMLSIQKIEKLLNCSLSEQKKQEILSLEENTKPARCDLTGQVFNRLLVIGRGPTAQLTSTTISQWWCICNCSDHNIILARANNLKSNNTKSCGCFNKEKSTERIKKIGHAMASDLTNQRFGKLVAIEPTTERNNGSVVWKCICDCGNIHYAKATELVRGSSTSCGCLKESRGVFKISQILKDNNIPFETEKTFNTCKFKDTNAYARFDFYVDQKFLIEFDGEQHFKTCDTLYFKDSLDKRQAHDQFKTQWCIDNHIPLIRFNYKELDKISLQEIYKRYSECLI